MNTIVTVITVALCLATVDCAPKRVDLFNRAGGRIVGGVPATLAQGTHQCSLWQKGWFGDGHICGCSLYGSKFAITAAHCTDGGETSSFTVKYGGLTVSSLDESTAVLEVRQHEQYDNPADSLDFDYSVLVLANTIKTSAGRVTTVTLASTEPAAGADAHVTGWGNTKSGRGNSAATQLQYAKLQIVDRAECKHIMNELPQDYAYPPITENMICARHEQGFTDCYGDSGGPIIVNGELAGIVSWGTPNCPLTTTYKNPSIYANVAKGKAWLESKLK